MRSRNKSGNSKEQTGKKLNLRSDQKRSDAFRKPQWIQRGSVKEKLNRVQKRKYSIFVKKEMDGRR